MHSNANDTNMQMHMQMHGHFAQKERVLATIDYNYHTRLRGLRRRKDKYFPLMSSRASKSQC